MFQCGLQIHFDSIRVNPIPQVSAIIIFYPYRCINSCVYILKFRLFTSFIRILVVAHERKTRCGSTFFAVLGAFFLREIPTKFPFLFSTIASYPFTRSHEPPGSFFLSPSLFLFSSSFFCFFFFFFFTMIDSRRVGIAQPPRSGMVKFYFERCPRYFAIERYVNFRY